MRIGIMSFAHVHADGFLHLLQTLEDVDFVGFSDHNTERGQHSSKQYNVKWFPSHEALLTEGLDAVVICSENAKHKDDVELATKAGAHVLCEKPIATTIEDALAIKAAVDKAGVNFMTAFPMRFDPSIKALKAMLERNELGKIYAINGINHSEIPRRHRAWFAQKSLAGGGAVMDHTVHLLDLYRWLLQSEPKEVYATVSNPFCPDVDVDTAGLATVTFDNSVFTAIDCSWSRTEAVYPRWGHLKMELIGEHGAIAVDAFAQYLNSYSKNASRQASWLGWGSDSGLEMMREFVSSIREMREPLVTWRDGFEAVKVALACYESSNAGQPISL
jgi:predicted dehydrogenase